MLERPRRHARRRAHVGEVDRVGQVRDEVRLGREHRGRRGQLVPARSRHRRASGERPAEERRPTRAEPVRRRGLDEAMARLAPRRHLVEQGGDARAHVGRRVRSPQREVRPLRRRGVRGGAVERGLRHDHRRPSVARGRDPVERLAGPPHEHVALAHLARVHHAPAGAREHERHADPSRRRRADRTHGMARPSAVHVQPRRDELEQPRREPARRELHHLRHRRRRARQQLVDAVGRVAHDARRALPERGRGCGGTAGGTRGRHGGSSTGVEALRRYHRRGSGRRGSWWTEAPCACTRGPLAAGPCVPGSTTAPWGVGPRCVRFASPPNRQSARS